MTLRLMIAAALFSCACSADATPQAQKPVAEDEPRPAATSGTQPAEPAAEKPAPAEKPAQAAPTQTAPRPQTIVQDGKVVNADAATLKDFSDRLAAYMDVHNKAKGQAPALKETSDAHQIAAAQDGLATRIRTLRASAKPGDVFTPAIRDKFRRLMYPELKGEDGADARKVLKDDAPAAGEVPMKVNAKYTADSLATTPANILLNLPTLPKGLEFRIVGKHLILLDVDASLIVDYIPNAIQ